MTRQHLVSDNGFGAFYAGNRDRCLRAAIALGVPYGEAEEVVAEAFARAYASWRKVSRYDAPAAWVVRTAVNHNISRWRKRRREVLMPVDEEQVHRDRHPELALDVARALQQLPARQREVVVLRYLLDLDAKTTARCLGIAPGTVGAHLHHALHSLRHELSQPQETP